MPIPTEQFGENTTYHSTAIEVDLSRSMGPFPFEPGRQLSAVPKSWRFGNATIDRLRQLGLARTRVWIRFTDAYDVTNRKPNYAALTGYLATYHNLSDQLVVNWQSVYDPLVTRGTMTEEELFTAQRDMLVYYKARFPNISYLEAENEPTSIDEYYPMYQLAYRIVNAVNDLGLAGPDIKVGGPALDTFSDSRLSQFLQLYKDDSTKGKRLDFVSYHQYLINTEGEWHSDKDYPAVVATERSRVDAMLRRYGLSTLPVLITESGAFPAERESEPQQGFEADLHIQAAGLASMHYYYASQKNIIPFDWTIDHPDNDRKDLFADTATGRPRPYYNAMLMAAVLPPTRFAATATGRTERGIGPYVMAAASTAKVAVMTWNYQWTYGQAFESLITVKELPERFREENVRVQSYRVASDVHSGDLELVSEYVLPPRSDGYWRAPAAPLGPNELRLIVLTTTSNPVTVV